jgi:hypothetical protein
MSRPRMMATMPSTIMVPPYSLTAGTPLLHISRCAEAE